MSQIAVHDLYKSYASVEVLRGIELQVAAGSVLALLGPSGCGKTTLLRLIAGFEHVERGRIAFGEQVVASAARFVPPERRSIGYVPQEGTLFPHLTVEGNIRYGLPRRGDHRQRVQEVLSLTGLQGLGARDPHELSGGQQQRVALARALAPGPSLVLLDEPFNALDLDLRRSICEEVVGVLRATGTTAILVTHDPGEAFAVSDQLAVMQAGQIMQCARPEAVYWQPADAAVARLTGSAIFVQGRCHAQTVDCPLGRLPLHDAAVVPDGSATVMLRPEQLRWNTAGQGVAARVVQRSFRGDHTMVGLSVGGLRLGLRMSSLHAPVQGDHGHVAVDGACMAYAGVQAAQAQCVAEVAE